jgi:23S rRNA (cytosine1962-C5)-methyltransferase
MIERRTTRNLLVSTAMGFGGPRRAVSRDDGPVEDYEFIDAGAGRRLERFGAHVVDRPHPGADGHRHAPDRWGSADLVFERETGWRGDGLAMASMDWSVDLAGLTFEARPTETGQVGLFPEHAATLPWLHQRIDDSVERPEILNLFAYTGLTTVALARAGAAVAHVDAARPAIEWARRNATRNGLEDRPIRWLVDDARAFVAREVRRERRYHGAVLDPPTYGHGTSGKAWRLARDLGPLLDDVRRLLVPDAFILLTAHATDLDAGRLGGYLGDSAETGDLVIAATSGASLRLGAFARLGRAS